MRSSRFTEEQTVAILQEHAAGAQTGELIRRHGISRETFCKWRRKSGGLKVVQTDQPTINYDENQDMTPVTLGQWHLMEFLQALTRCIAKHTGPRAVLEPSTGRGITWMSLRATAARSTFVRCARQGGRSALGVGSELVHGMAQLREQLGSSTPRARGISKGAGRRSTERRSVRPDRDG